MVPQKLSRIYYNEAKELLRRITEQVDYLIPRISKTVVDLKPTKKVK